MIRVCHMTSVHPWDDVRIFHKECRSLAAAGFDVHLVACAPEPIQLDGVMVHSVPRTGKGRLARMLRTTRHIYLAARAVNADIYHFHDPELIPYGLLLRLHGKQVVYDAHEDVPRDVLSKPWIAPWLRGKIARLFEWFEDWAAGRLSAVVGATPHIARRFSRINLCSVDINNYPMQSELASDAIAARSGRTVCYVGGVSRIRGAKEMVAAMEYVDGKLILAGRIENAALEAELRALPGWSKVEYRGTVSRAEVRRIFSESCAGLLLFHPEPNHLDAQPNKMFEYMSAGLPLIASDFPLWRQVLDTTGAGVCVDPLDPRSIAKCISTLLDDRRGTSCMGEAGRRAVAATYRWERETTKLIGLYRDLTK